MQKGTEMNKKIIRLFNFFPILKIEETEKGAKYYLFAFLPIIYIRHKKIHKKFDGYNNEYTQRNRKICARIGEDFYCGGKVLLTPNTYLGDHCSFNGCEIHGRGRVTIGSHFHSGIELLIIAQNHNYDHGQHIPYTPEDYIYKDIEIGDCVWIGSRVTILPGTKIGEGAIIQAGSVVHDEIPPMAIAGGNPAKVFKYRNKKHYIELKNKKSFN